MLKTTYSIIIRCNNLFKAHSKEKATFYKKNTKKNLEGQKKNTTFALAFENNVWKLGLRALKGRMGEWLKPAVC